ncbi:MAG: APC family permease [Alphaproteobacteria bacterium]
MSESAPALRGNIGRFQLFAFGFGSIIGSSWCVLAGSWIGSAGPGGAFIGFALGGIVVACIGACYAELTSRLPVTGGEFTFVLNIFGRGLAFYVGWFIAFAWILVTIFEGLAIAWLFERLNTGVPDVALYTVGDTTVTRNALLIGGTVAPAIAFLNWRGGQLLARFHSLLTYTFIAVALAMVMLMLGHGAPANWVPLLPAQNPVWWEGAAAIFANCAFLLCGFQAVSQVVEEKSARLPFSTLFRILVLTVVAASGFYCVVVLGTAIMMPWQTLPPHSLAFVESARLLPGGNVLVPLVLVIAILSLLKTWNGCVLMASRTLIALQREGLMPQWMNKWHGRSGVPGPIILVILAMNVAGLPLGRGAVGMLVDAITISLVFGYAICCIGLPVLRKRQGARADVVAASNPVVVIGVVGAVVMAVLAVVMPLVQAGGWPPVFWIFPAWTAIGTLVLLAIKKANREV